MCPKGSSHFVKFRARCVITRKFRIDKLDLVYISYESEYMASFAWTISNYIAALYQSLHGVLTVSFTDSPFFSVFTLFGRVNAVFLSTGQLRQISVQNLSAKSVVTCFANMHQPPAINNAFEHDPIPYLRSLTVPTDFSLPWPYHRCSRIPPRQQPL